MSTAVKSDREAIPDWAVGYSEVLPCDWNPPCDHEAEWFGNQHGCVRANICDDHMKLCYHDVNFKIDTFGSVKCRRCRLLFTDFNSFIKAVRI